MNKNKHFIFLVLAIFIISSAFHFMYNILPNNFIAAFFPVNESIFEHMKMIFNSYIVTFFLEYLYLRKNNNKFNYIFRLLTSTLSCIFITMILYYPFYYLLGNNFIITMIGYIISIIISVYIANIIYKNTSYDKVIDIISLLIMLFLEFFFIYLTFNPKESQIFIDKVNNKIGIYSYIEAPKED